MDQFSPHENQQSLKQLSGGGFQKLDQTPCAKFPPNGHVFISPENLPGLTFKKNHPNWRTGDFNHHLSNQISLDSFRFDVDMLFSIESPFRIIESAARKPLATLDHFLVQLPGLPKHLCWDEAGDSFKVSAIGWRCMSDICIICMYIYILIIHIYIYISCLFAKGIFTK